MASVAEQLRTAREAQHLTLHQVAEATKIRTDHLSSLEAGDYSVFMAPVYIRGFVRSYARLLKLDIPALMAELDAELKKDRQFSELPPLTNEPRGFLDDVMLFLSKVNWSIALPILGVILALVLGTLGYQAYRRHKNADPLANLGSGQYQPKPESKDLYLPLPTNGPRK